VKDPWRDWIPPHPNWDAVLRAAPSHIFLFDSTLTCRYAAPSGEAFLSQSQEQLTGRHASEILPPAANGLRPVLERAANEASRSSIPQYRYRHRRDDGEIAYVWAVEVEPLTLAGQQCVLVALRDVLELVEERDELGLEKGELAEQLHQLRRANEEREQELVAAEVQLRTLLTSALGYLQILTRQPQHMESRSVAETIDEMILPPLREVVQLVNALDRFPR
jgi:PAS domain S-box-containing protein